MNLRSSSTAPIAHSPTALEHEAMRNAERIARRTAAAAVSSVVVVIVNPTETALARFESTDPNARPTDPAPAMCITDACEGAACWWTEDKLCIACLDYSSTCELALDMSRVLAFFGGDVDEARRFLREASHG